MDHDAAHKHIYALPAVVADLLRLVVPAWADDLDLTTLEDLSPEFFDDEHRRRVGDMVWRVRFRGGRDGNGRKPSVLVLIEFQSTVDRAMAKRVREYTELLLERLARQGTVSRESGTPWMLPIVVYNGSERWTAPGEAAALSPVPSARAERDLTALQPQAYRLLTAGRTLTGGGWSAEDWPAANRVAATVRLQRYGGTRRPCCRGCARRWRDSPARRIERFGKRCTPGRGHSRKTARASVRSCPRSRNWSSRKEEK